MLNRDGMHRQELCLKPKPLYPKNPHPSAPASSVLQRPSGASMLAAASMPMVRGSSVSSAAARSARAAFPARMRFAASETAASDDEHAVSMLMAGPAAERLGSGGAATDAA